MIDLLREVDELVEVEGLMKKFCLGNEGVFIKILSFFNGEEEVKFDFFKGDLSESFKEIEILLLFELNAKNSPPSLVE